jgi:aryl-alcohol dehydrogenase-like predicted oxidoreductase
MRTRRLGPLELSVVGLGCNNFGGRIDEEATFAVIDAAIDAGVTFFDTSNTYGNHGASEELIGRALQGRRDQVVLATKWGKQMGDGAERRGSRDYILGAIEASLRRLQMDVIDLYQHHEEDPETPLEETVATVEQLVAEGTVRAWGTSNYRAETLERVRALASDAYVSEQSEYSLLRREAETELLPTCARLGLGFIPYFPLAGGLLTGKYRREHNPKAGGRFDNNRMYQERYWHDDYFAAVDELAGAAKEAGKTLVELSYQWLLNQETVDSIILGASRLEQLEENLRSCETARLDGATLARCDEVWKRLRGIVPKYNR